MKILKKLLLVILILPLSIVSLQAGQSDDGIQRLALQVSDNDPKTLNKVLNVAANFARGQTNKGNTVSYTHLTLPTTPYV